MLLWYRKKTILKPTTLLTACNIFTMERLQQEAYNTIILVVLHHN